MPTLHIKKLELMVVRWGIGRLYLGVSSKTWHFGVHLFPRKPAIKKLFGLDEVWHDGPNCVFSCFPLFAVVWSF